MPIRAEQGKGLSPYNPSEAFQSVQLTAVHIMKTRRAGSEDVTKETEAEAETDWQLSPPPRAEVMLAAPAVQKTQVKNKLKHGE